MNTSLVPGLILETSIEAKHSQRYSSNASEKYVCLPLLADNNFRVLLQLLELVHAAG